MTITSSLLVVMVALTVTTATMETFVELVLTLVIKIYSKKHVEDISDIGLQIKFVK